MSRDDPPQHRSPRGALARAAAWAAPLVAAAPSADAWMVLREALQRVAPHRNFVVFEYARDRTPLLVDSNRARDYMLAHLADYLRALYQLDPFYGAFAQGRSGFHRMDDIAPENFRESEYFLRHYRSTDIVDELRYLVPTGDGRSMHVCLERENDTAGFSAAEVTRFAAAEPIVDAYVRGHSAWLREHGPSRDAGAPAFDLRAQIRAMAPGDLTPRECEIVERMLGGHSAKSIAAVLGIEEGTVTNHKRNVYAKLGLHSQAQLFDRFLRALSKGRRLD